MSKSQTSVSLFRVVDFQLCGITTPGVLSMIIRAGRFYLSGVSSPVWAPLFVAS
jgi:hypothetical protein